jgi:hypothetical protein
MRRCSAASSAGDLRRAARRGEELEVQRHERGVARDELLERAHEHVQQLVGRSAADGDRLVERGQAQVRVAPHDLDQQPLLGAEVVVQEPARDPGLPRDVVERGARGAAAATDARMASTIRWALSAARAAAASMARMLACRSASTQGRATGRLPHCQAMRGALLALFAIARRAVLVPASCRRRARRPASARAAAPSSPARSATSAR